MKQFPYYFMLGLFCGSAFAGQIHVLVFQQNIPSLEELLQVDPTLVDTLDEDGNTPLDIAMRICPENETVLSILWKYQAIADEMEWPTPDHSTGSHSSNTEKQGLLSSQQILQIAHQYLDSHEFNNAKVERKKNNKKRIYYLATFWNS